MKAKNLIKEILSETNFSLFEKILKFYLEEVNKVNFTSIKNEEEFVIKHFLDSLIPLDFLNLKSGSKILDLGTGGGFPGIPLALALNDCEFTLLDAVKKKIEVIDKLLNFSPLRNVITLWGRAEILAKKPSYREKYDFVLTRAVADWPILLEFSLPFLKKGGKFFAYKGPNDYEQIKNYANKLDKLGGGNVNFFEYQLENLGNRYVVSVEKLASTPDIYPRSYNAITKRPLN